MTGLAKRAVACPGWRWMPGMLARFLDDEPLLNPARLVAEGEGDGLLDPDDAAIPDLSDPLTVQALLLLVREAWATETVWVEPGHDGLWEMCIYVSGAPRLLESYQTEAEALVAALEAASL